MSKSTPTQDVPAPKTVALNMTILIAVVTGLATLVVTVVACWFLFINIHSDARAAVIQDIQLVSKAQK